MGILMPVYSVNKADVTRRSVVPGVSHVRTEKIFENFTTWYRRKISD